jgi:D-3-phosphoglycerate dehydrogenase / 2-oxoglutarate reductase
MQMLKAIVSDHTFPSLDLQRNVIEAAGFEIGQAQPKCVTEDDVIARCGDADVLLVQWAAITRRAMKNLPKLRAVVRYGIGVDNIDLDAARELRIGVANVPTYCLEEVSNHAMAMMLSLARRIPQDHAGILHGEWGVGPYLPIPAFLDMTLGLVSFGAIARRVARKAKAFGFRIVAADPFVDESVFKQEGVERVAMEELFKTSDIISLHCPLVPATTHLIRRETIATMKPGVVIINTSRGPVIREADLADALASGKVVAAGLDVFEREPLPADSPLRSMRNVLLTSHAASASSRAAVALQVKAAEAARDLLEGKRPEGALVWPSASNQDKQ